VTFRNITLRNIAIVNPKISPGVILGNTSNPIADLIFENVQVTEAEELTDRPPFGDAFFCNGVSEYSSAESSPELICT
jgi:hypothetical protein